MSGNNKRKRMSENNEKKDGWEHEEEYKEGFYVIKY